MTIRHPVDRRDQEILHLRRQLAEAEAREREVRAEERERFSALTAAGKRFAASMRSRMDERQRQQRRLDAQYAVSRVLEDSRDLLEAAPGIFRALGTSLGWDVGVLWTVEAGALVCAGTWRLGGVPADGFAEACRGHRFPRGAGLPGRVWRREEPCWVEDLLGDEGYVRREVASEGLRCALAFPVQDGGRLVGVFELLKREPSPTDDDMLRLVYLVGHQMGQFVERRRAEAERDRALFSEREARRQANGVLESISDAFFAVDRGWRLTYVNRRTEEFWRRGREDLLGKKLWEEIPAAVGSQVGGDLHRAMENRETVGFETPLPGTRRWISARAYPSVDGLSVYFQDISERRRAKEALEKSEERYRTLTANIPGAVFRAVVVDGQPSMRFVSDHVRELTGYPAGDFVADHRRNYGEIVHPEDRPNNDREVWRSFEAREPYSIEYCILHSDGGIRWMNERGSGVYDEDGVLLSVDGVIFDVTEHKRAEEALRASEARLASDLAGMRRLYELHSRLANETDLKAALDEILAAACDFTHTGRGCVQLVSDDGERLEMFAWRGYSGGSPFIEHFRHEGLQDGCDAARLERRRVVVEDARTHPGVEGADLEAVLADGILASQSTPMISRQGEPVGVLSTQFAEPHRPGDDELRLVELLAWTAADFVERHRADAALRESEERFRAVANLVPDLLWSNDLSGHTGWLNRRWMEYTGQSAEEARGYGWLEAVHPDDRERSRANFMTAVKRGEPLLQEHRVRATDGSYRWFLVRAEPVRDAEGRSVRWFGAGTDVHEQRTALEALRENEAWLRLAQSAARSGTWEWDLLSGEIRWSGEHRELFGFDRSDEPIEREDWWAAVHPEDLPRIEEAGRRCLEEDEEWPEIEYRIFRDGEVRWIDARGRTERDEGGRAVRIRGISVDTTERKKAEAERDRLLAREWVAAAEAAERERISRELHDRVAHSIGVAHQSLQLYEVLARKDAARAAEKLELAKETTKASLESTRNLSAELRQLEAEEGLEAELVHLLDVSVPPSIESSLRVEGDEAGVPGHVRGQLFLILREAIRNAVSHSGCRSIAVGLEVGPGRIAGRVEDDGRGFDATDGHVGVGLRSMRERVALLDGSLNLDCTPGKGTRIEVTVPLEGER